MRSNNFSKSINIYAVGAFLVLIIFFPFHVLSQGAEENVKKFVNSEIEAFLNRDARLWEDLWLHDDKTTRVFVSADGYYSKSGWNAFGPKMVSFLKSQPKSTLVSIARDSFKIRNYKDIAWVEFNLTVSV